MQLAQLWRESRPVGSVLHTHDGVAYIPAEAAEEPTPAASSDVFIVTENRTPPER